MLYDLGRMCRHLGQHEAGRGHLDRCLSIQKQEFSESDPEIVNTRKELAACFRGLGLEEEAKKAETPEEEAEEGQPGDEGAEDTAAVPVEEEAGRAAAVEETAAVEEAAAEAPAAAVSL